MGILEFLECFDPLTEICVEDATEVVFEGRTEDFPEEKDKAYSRLSRGDYSPFLA